MAQMIEHIHGEPVADIQTVGHHPVRQFFHGKTFALKTGCLSHQKALAYGSTEGIDADDLPLRKFLLQVFYRDLYRLVGAGESR